jgi:hypothetical protein
MFRSILVQDQTEILCCHLGTRSRRVALEDEQFAVLWLMQSQRLPQGDTQRRKVFVR